ASERDPSRQHRPEHSGDHAQRTRLVFLISEGKTKCDKIALEIACAATNRPAACRSHTTCSSPIFHRWDPCDVQSGKPSFSAESIKQLVVVGCRFVVPADHAAPRLCAGWQCPRP